MVQKQISRYRWVDIAKGIAILSIVLFHIKYAYHNSTWMPVRALFGYLWHVPIFFLLGGFFIKEEKLLQPIPFIKGKVKSLYLLILYFYIPAVLLHNVFIDMGWYAGEYSGKLMAHWDMMDILKNIMMTICLAGREPILGAMWFVYVLFIALCGFSIVSWGVRRMIKNNASYEWVRAIVLFVICVISCIATQLLDITIPRFSNSLTAMWLIYVGYILIHKLDIKFDNKWAALFSVILCYHIATIQGGVDLNINRYHDVLSLSVTSVAALYVICFVSKRIENTKLGHIFAYCGRESFYIMALHFVGFKIGCMICNLMGYELQLHSLTAPAGGSVFLLIWFLAFGMLFPLIFMFVFRKIKKVITK